MRFRVGVVGVSGYSGLELMKIVLRHPAMECLAVMASEATGEKPLGEIHPQLREVSSLKSTPQDPERLAALGLDTVFLCTPNEVSYELAPKLLDYGMRVIDLSGSFRLRDVASYSPWYGFHHDAPQLLGMAVYGLSEWHGARLAAATPEGFLEIVAPYWDDLVAYQGAFFLSDALPPNHAATPFPARAETATVLELGWDLANFTFVPHLLPVNRGMLSTLYLEFHHPVSSEELEAQYRRRYAGHPFVRVLGGTRLPELRAVNHTNFCDIGWRLTGGGRRAVVFSALDNLIKGAAGQAVQNFNLMHGLEETLGLVEGEAVAVHG